MNKDVSDFINFLNKNSESSSKRKRDEINSDQIYNDMKKMAMERIEKLNIKDLRQINNAIKNLKNIFNSLKLDTRMPLLLKKAMCAEISLAIEGLTSIKNHSNKNPGKRFNELINILKSEIDYTIKNDTLERVKRLNSNSDDSSELYESDSSNSESDFSDDSNNETIDFVDEVFKSNDEDTEDKIKDYFNNLSSTEQETVQNLLKEVNNYQSTEKPILFKILELPLSLGERNHILKKYLSLVTNREVDNKLKNWLDVALSIPWSKHTGINLDSIKKKDVKNFLNNLQNKMDEAVYGHEEAKRQIIQMMAQQIRNPTAKGNIIGIYGCMGNGKTSLVKEGIAKAMNKPFIFISLGGATDASFLEGHSYTYEGSIPGRIVEGLISSKCMDPIIYFDELDKISKTHKGDEITNILIHLTDPVQNVVFRDKYLNGLNIDLSRATMIFSFNDPSEVNPILLDRITSVETKFLTINQKIHIAQNYLLPVIMRDMGLNMNDILISNENVEYIIERYTKEGGVRKLKNLLYSIIREINLSNLTGTKIENNRIKFPFTINNNHIKQLLKHKREIEDEKVSQEDRIGFVNGLYACSSYGGILPIQTIYIPSDKLLTLKTTGNLQKVIRESIDVACSLAWSYLDSNRQEELMKFWSKTPQGIHIHCPDGSISKDGPSAGGAITLAFYSLFMNKKIRHNFAMTGEINFEGRITAIGGLEEKLEGAKKTGVNLVLIPKENVKDLDKILIRNPRLIDNNFKVIAIETFNEVIKYALI